MMCKSSLRLAVVVVVCALSISCGRREEEPEESIAREPAPEAAAGTDVGDGEPATSSTVEEVASSRLSYVAGEGTCWRGHSLANSSLPSFLKRIAVEPGDQLGVGPVF